MKDTTEEKFTKRKSAPVAHVDLETIDQTIDDVEKKTTELSPMPNAEELEANKFGFQPFGNGDQITGNTPDTKKGGSETKNSSFMERLVAMVVMRPKHKEQ